MTDPKFTPGPWIADITPGKCEHDTSGKAMVRNAKGHGILAGFSENRAADVRAVAAFPDLYAALEAVTSELRAILKDECCDHAVGICWCGTFGVIEDAVAALAKARGEG
jgi:hypothetical protein